MAQDQPVQPFNVLAKDFDPMMPQEQYDAVRTKYFDDHVAPKVPRNFSVSATREEFMKSTNRAPLVTHPTSAKLALGGLATATQLLQPLKDVNPGARKLYDASRTKQASLQASMARDGIGTTGAQVAGDLLGSGIAFAGVEAATDGAGSALGVDELLSGVAQASKATALASKLSKGALAFGTYEALTDEGKHRGYAFAKGAAMGAAFDGSFSLLGRLARSGAEVKPEAVEKEVANALSPDPKPMDPKLDQTLAQHIKGSQERAKAEGKPLFVKPDETSRKTRVLGTDSTGQPFTVHVEPDAEGRALDAIKSKLASGGSIDAVLYHPDEINSFNRFAKMTKDLGIVPQTETRVVNTAEGEAKKVAASMNAEGIPAEPVGKSKVHVETPKPQVPNLTRIRSDLATHELPDGTRLTQGETWDYAKRIRQLHDPAIPPSTKETTARQLAGKGFEKFIPEEWQRSVEDAGVEAEEHIPDEVFDPREKELAEIYAETIGERTRAVSKAAPLDTDFRNDRPSMEGFQVVDRADKTSRETFAIPKSEQTVVSIDRSGKLTRRDLPDRIRVRASEEDMEKYVPGSAAFVARSDKGELPVQVFGAKPTKHEVYHEDLHVHLTPHTDLLNEAIGGHSAALDISEGLKDYGAYKNLSPMILQEEAYVHAATAIRMGDKGKFDQLVKYDTSASHVLDMVDGTTSHLLEGLSRKVDSQENRAFDERLRDLLRRTGRQRLERWQDGAARAGHDLFYDADADAFVLASERGQTALTPKVSVADEIEQAQGGAEYVPDDSIIFQQTGVRLPMARPNGLPYSGKDVPMAELTPQEDKFKGLATASALIRPTMDWAAHVDSKFEAAGRKLGFYDKMKDVDDAVRLGQDWLVKNYSDAAKFLSGDANRLKTMFEFLSADPKHWERMLPRFNMDSKFLADVRSANKWLMDFKDSTNIQVFNYLRNDLGRLRGFNYDTSFVYGRGIKDESQMSFFHKAIVNGDLNPRDGHAGRFVNFLLRAGYEKKFTEKPLKELDKLLRLEDKNGMSMLGTLRFPVQNYANYVRGIPDVSQQVITKGISDFQKNLGLAFKEVNKHLPAGMKLPEEFNYPGNLFNRMISLSYMAGIGLRPIIPVRDMIQVITNTLPVLGPAKMLEGLRHGLSSAGFEEARAAGALLDKHNIGELYGDIFHEMPPHSGGTLDKAMQVGNMLLAPSRWGHNIGRSVAYHGELGAATKAIGAYRAGRSDVRKMFEDTSMWFFPKQLQTRIMRDVMDHSVPVSEVAKKIALETVDSTLWAYRRGTQPMALRTGLGRIFGQYGMWPLNYMEFLRKAIGKRAEYPSKTMRMMGLWVASNYAASSTLGAMGGDVSKWFFFSPAGYGGSPHLKLAQDIMKAPEESEDGRQARKDILTYPMGFVPGQIELKAILKATEDGSPMFNSDGSPSEDFVRVLGMKPKNEHLQDLSPEEWMQYETGFKGGRTH